MFDPSIFDNLKIVLEGAVYDRDLSSHWVVLNRADRLDLAAMSRDFRIQFCVKDEWAVMATVSLRSVLKDFAAEWLADQVETPGCFLEVVFTMQVRRAEECARIESLIQNIWGGRPLLSQELSFKHPHVEEGFKNEITLHFDRKIDESNIVDLESVLEHVHQTLDELNKWSRV